MLGQPVLTTHALTVLTAMSTLPEAPANRLRDIAAPDGLQLVLRSRPHDDVVVTVNSGAATIALAPIDETGPAAELDPAARLLLLWGRRDPGAAIDVFVDGDRRRVLDVLFGW